MLSIVYNLQIFPENEAGLAQLGFDAVVWSNPELFQ